MRRRAGPRGPPIVPGLLVALAAASLLLPGTGGAPTSGRLVRPASGAVLAIEESPGYLLEQEALTVSVEVADAGAVAHAYFTFCQITKSLCYLPTTMNATTGGWFVGTTYPMTHYPGMLPGIQAGYNITISLSNGTNLTEPTAQNGFANLTLSKLNATGELVFEVTVENHRYGLSGQVVAAANATALGGATVSLSPAVDPPVTTGSNGSYSFANVSNGSYTISVAKDGYRTGTLSVTVAGASLGDKDLALANASSSSTSSGGSGGKSSGFLGPLTETETVAVAAVVAVVIVVPLVVLALGRRRRGASPPAAP